MDTAPVENFRRAVDLRLGMVVDMVERSTDAATTQCMGLGRIGDDAATTGLGNERWADAMFDFIDRALLTPDE